METYADCITACEACVLACERGAGDLHPSVRSLALECSQACQLAMAALAREGVLAAAACSVCASLCEQLYARCLGRAATVHACAAACARAAAQCRMVQARIGARAVAGREALAA